ncbi:MAG: hypothetical protein AAGF99_00450 [Bacteroidota bacterium]
MPTRLPARFLNAAWQPGTPTASIFLGAAPLATAIGGTVTFSVTASGTYTEAGTVGIYREVSGGPDVLMGSTTGVESGQTRQIPLPLSASGAYYALLSGTDAPNAESLRVSITVTSSGGEADYTVADIAAAQALAMQDGETVEVTDTGRGRTQTYRRVALSSLTYRVIDGQSILLPDDQAESVAVGPFLPSQLEAQSFGINLELTSLRFTASGPSSVRWGATEMSWLDLHGAAWGYATFFTGDAVPYLDPEAGTVTDFRDRPQSALALTGDQITLTGRRLSGTHVLVCEDFLGFDALQWSGPLDGATRDERVTQAYRNGCAVNWAHQLASMDGAPRLVHHSDTVDLGGTIRYPRPDVADPARIRGFGTDGALGHVPTYRMAGEDVAIEEYLYPDNDDQQPSNLGGSIWSVLQCARTTFLKPRGTTGTTRGCVFENVWVDGNRDNIRYRTGIPVDIADRYAEVRNSPYLCGFGGNPIDEGQEGLFRAVLDGPCRFDETWGHNLHTGNHGEVIYDAGSLTALGDVQLELGRCGWDNPHHGTYGFDQTGWDDGTNVPFPKILVRKRLADIMSFDQLKIAEVEVIDPEAEDDGRTNHLLALRDTGERDGVQTRGSGLERMAIVPHVHGHLSDGYNGLFKTDSFFGPVKVEMATVAARLRTDRSGFTLLDMQDSQAYGVFGPETGDFEVEAPGGTMVSLYGGSNPNVLDPEDKILIRNVLRTRAAGDTGFRSGGNFGHLAVRCPSFGVGRARIVNFRNSFDRPEVGIDFNASSSSCGADVIFEGGEFDASVPCWHGPSAGNYGVERQEESQRLRVIFDGTTALGTAVIPTVATATTEGYAATMFGRVFRGRGVVDQAGRPSEASGTATAAGGETVLYVPTGLLWGAREYVVAPQGGAPAPTSVEVVTETGDTVYDREWDLPNGPLVKTDFANCRLKLTFAAPLSAGNAYDWEARVTPEVEWAAARLGVRVYVDDAIPSASVSAGGTTQVDVAAITALREWGPRSAPGAAASGTVTYSVSSSDETKATATVNAAGVVTITGVAIGSCVIYVDCVAPADGTVTRVSIDIDVL